MRSGARSRRSTRRKARLGCAVIWRSAWSRCSPSRGSSTSIRRSSRSTAIRKGRCSATIRRSPGVRATATTPISMASTRLVLDVDVSPGDEHTSKHGAPGLWAFLDRLPRDLWPALLRGDCGFGNEGDHARGGGAGTSLSLQAAPDPERPAHDREALRARMGQRRSGLLGQGERGSAGRLEPRAAHHRCSGASEGRRGAFLRRASERGAATFLRRDRRGDRNLRILGSRHLARRGDGGVRSALSRPGRRRETSSTR